MWLRTIITHWLAPTTTIGIISITCKHLFVPSIASDTATMWHHLCPCEECETIKVKAITLRTCHYCLRWTEKTCVWSTACSNLINIHWKKYRREKLFRIKSSSSREKRQREWNGEPKSESFAIENNNIRSWMRERDARHWYPVSEMRAWHANEWWPV